MECSAQKVSSKWDFVALTTTMAKFIAFETSTVVTSATCAEQHKVSVELFIQQQHSKPIKVFIAELESENLISDL